MKIMNGKIEIAPGFDFWRIDPDKATNAEYRLIATRKGERPTSGYIWISRKEAYEDMRNYMYSNRDIELLKFSKPGQTIPCGRMHSAIRAVQLATDWEFDFATRSLFDRAGGEFFCKANNNDSTLAVIYVHNSIALYVCAAENSEARQKMIAESQKPGKVPVIPAENMSWSVICDAIDSINAV